MQRIRRILIFFLFVCLIAGNTTVTQALGPRKFSPIWYIPRPMASVDAAIATIKELKPDDVIAEATSGEKIYPISSWQKWNEALQEVVDGKPETTIQAKIIRNGVVMTKSIQVINVGFGITVIYV